jgi:hypothetical protein
MKANFFIFFFLLGSIISSFGQRLKPTKSIVIDEKVHETSGLLFWNNKLWTHNDDGDTNLYGLDKSSGEILETIALKNVVNKDWESISQDENYIYIGDFGNNVAGNRTDLHILRIEKERLLQGIQEIDSINFKYSNQKDFTPKKSNKTDFDGEAFIVSTDSIFIFTKQWKSKKTSVYAFPKLPGNHIASLKTTFKVRGLITDATFIENNKQIVLCGYSKKLKPFLYVLSNYKEGNFFSGNKSKIKLKLPFYQIEGITFDGEKIYLSNEQFVRKPFINTKQKLHEIDFLKIINH